MYGILNTHLLTPVTQFLIFHTRRQYPGVSRNSRNWLFSARKLRGGYLGGGRKAYLRVRTCRDAASVANRQRWTSHARAPYEHAASVNLYSVIQNGCFIYLFYPGSYTRCVFSLYVNKKKILYRS